MIPNFQEFIEEYMSEEALGLGGYLSERGLVTLNDSETRGASECRHQRHRHGCQVGFAARSFARLFRAKVRRV